MLVLFLTVLKVRSRRGIMIIANLKKISQFVKMAIFWIVAPCSLVEVYPLVSTRLHGATNQNTAIFILAAVRT
jgi:hypothetical protein